MNQKKPYPGDNQPEYLHEVKVNGRRLVKGMQATLPPERGGARNRRYEFRYGEIICGRAVKLTGNGLIPDRGGQHPWRRLARSDLPQGDDGRLQGGLQGAPGRAAW